MAGMVGPYRPGHRDPPLAALPVGAGERSRAAHLRLETPRQGNCTRARRRASICLSARARRPCDCGAAVTPRSLRFEQLWGIFACLALALLARLGALPAWGGGVVAGLGGGC